MNGNPYTIVGDLHIDDRYLVELENIFNELIQYKGRTIIFLGDVFHNNNPSPKEIYFALKWFKKFKEQFNNVLVILGNHDIYGDFQTTNILKHVNIQVISKNKWPLKTSFGSLYFVHDFVKESIENFNKNKHRSIQDITAEYNYSFKYIFMGHQHIPQQLADNACHLGSIRYVSFGEYEEPLKPKRIATISDNGEVEFHEIQNTHNLKQFNSLKQLLKNYKSKPKEDVIVDKIRLKYTDFETYLKDLDKMEKIPLNLLHKPKIKLDFKNEKNIIKEYDTSVNKPNISTKKIVKKWLDTISNDSVKQILAEESQILCD